MSAGNPFQSMAFKTNTFQPLSFTSTPQLNPQVSTHSQLQSLQSQPSQPQIQQQSQEKDTSTGIMIQCLQESKNIQSSMLQELRQLVDIMRNQPKQSASQTNQQTGPFSAKSIHFGVWCNNCGKNNITGFRYKCLFCKDFDICEECECKPIQSHDAAHSFIRIKDSSIFTTLINEKRNQLSI